ncbi:MAG: XRE family transcriptional regulator [Clostridia bacterium]|nr:XRE family transcriptional regulator [Clostridia bacterium]
MIDVKLIGERIRELRRKRGLTQSEFADRLMVSFQAVSNWERGIAPPDLENLIRIASFFGVLTDDLLRPARDSLFLGIDGGGTKTEFAVVTADGSVIKRILRGGCNPNDVGFAKTLSVISDGIHEILLEHPALKAVFCGVAGILTGGHERRLHTELSKLYPQLKIEVKTDSANLFAMDDGAHMAVISGTGSVVFVRRGEAHTRIGGWGYLLDEAGSGYDIGRDAIRVALEEEDGQTEPSILGTLVRRHMGVDAVSDHLGKIYGGGKPYIAGFSETVFEAYGQGDTNAADIIDKTARAIAKLLNRGVETYGAEPRAIASGGIFENHGDILCPAVKKYSTVELTVNCLPPVYGACRAACALGGHALTDSFSQNFNKTYGGYTV